MALTCHLCARNTCARLCLAAALDPHACITGWSVYRLVVPRLHPPCPCFVLSPPPALPPPALPPCCPHVPQVASLSLELSNLRRADAQVNGELALTQQELAQAQQELSDARCAHSGV